MIHGSEKICPRCNAPKLKDWRDLNEEEKDVIDRMGIITFDNRAEIEQHRICTRCWYSADLIRQVA